MGKAKTKAIAGFSGNYSFLSNFHPCPILVAGLLYPSVEHAYQAAKSNDRKTKFKFTIITAREAKALGRAIECRPDWEDVKLKEMKALLQIKFAPDTELAAKLQKTGEAKLIELNWWHDTFWGECPLGNGQNWLGLLLMEVRQELKGA